MGNGGMILGLMYQKHGGYVLENEIQRQISIQKALTFTFIHSESNS